MCPMLGVTSVEAAEGILAGVEHTHIWCTSQWVGGAERGFTAAEPFDALAASSPPRHDYLFLF